jgi:hypothetical protein
MLLGVGGGGVVVRYTLHKLLIIIDTHVQQERERVSSLVTELV